MPNRSFRARVRVYTLDQRLVAEAEAAFELETIPFTPTRWFGTMSTFRPGAPPPGRYLLRFPNGKVSEAELHDVDFAGCKLLGVGPTPLG